MNKFIFKQFVVLIVFSISGLFILSGNADAATCSTIEGCALYVEFNNPDNQTWDTKYTITDGVTKTPARYVDVPANGKASVYYGWVDYRAAIPSLSVTWYTSCADPTVTVTYTGVNRNGIFSIYYYALTAGTQYGCRTPSNVTCSGNTYKHADFAACLYVPQNGNRVDFTGQCPQNRAIRYCASASTIYGIPSTNCAVLVDTNWKCTSTCRVEGRYYCSGYSRLYETRANNSCTSGCTTPTPTPTPSATCDFTTPERRMVDSCTYQTCLSPSPGSWGPNQSCPPNTTLVSVANAFKYSCQTSAGSCTTEGACF